MVTKVTAAILVDGGNIFIAKRGPEGRFAHLWEFPGGKIEPGESPEECLIREMHEELGITIQIDSFFMESVHTFPGGRLLVLAYYCRWTGGDMALIEHEECRWVKAADLGNFEFAPADAPIAARLSENSP